jgi:hypothetical protein
MSAITLHYGPGRGPCNQKRPARSQRRRIFLLPHQSFVFNRLSLFSRLRCPNDDDGNSPKSWYVHCREARRTSMKLDTTTKASMWKIPEQEVRREPELMPIYSTVADYDPVLRAHCRLNVDPVIFPSLPPECPLHWYRPWIPQGPKRSKR